MSTTPLPRDEDGHINTSAEYGTCWVVQVTYNTDPDGKPVDFDDDSNQTLHGPFDTVEEAQEWMDDFCPDDTDIKDVVALNLNRVRPA